MGNSLSPSMFTSQCVYTHYIEGWTEAAVDGEATMGNSLSLSVLTLH